MSVAAELREKATEMRNRAEGLKQEADKLLQAARQLDEIANSLGDAKPAATPRVAREAKRPRTSVTILATRIVAAEGRPMKLQEIVDRLTAQGHRSGTGQPWNVHSLQTNICKPGSGLVRVGLGEYGLATNRTAEDAEPKPEEKPEPIGPPTVAEKKLGYDIRAIVAGQIIDEIKQEKRPCTITLLAARLRKSENLVRSVASDCVELHINGDSISLASRVPRRTGSD